MSGVGEGDMLLRQMYLVDWIVKMIMRGLEEVYLLVRQRVSEEREKVKGGGEEKKEDNDEEGWNWMMEDGDMEMIDV